MIEIPFFSFFARPTFLYQPASLSLPRTKKSRMDDPLNNPKVTLSKTFPTSSLSAYSLWTQTGIIRILALPEIVDVIVGYLRPFQVLQARLVSREFNTAFSPYLRLHLDTDFKGPAAGAVMLGLHLRRQKASKNECEACAKKSINPWMEPAKPRPQELGHDQEQEQEQGQGKRLVQGLGETLGPGLNATMLSEYGHLVESCELVLDEMLRNRMVQQQQNEQWRKLVGLDREGESDVDLVQRHCPHLTLLKIHHHRHGLEVYDDIVIAFPRLESFDVSFYDKADLETFFDMLIQQAAPLESPLSPPTDSASTSVQQSPPPKMQSRGLQRLKQLAIYNRGIWSNGHVYSWYSLSDLLSTCPKLNTLTFQGVNWDMFSYSPRASSPDELEPSSWSESLDPPAESLDDLARTDRFPQIQSLTLGDCEISQSGMVRISRVFPNLKTLKINTCHGQWPQALYDSVPAEIVFSHKKNSDGSYTDIDLDILEAKEVDIGEKIQNAVWFPKLERLQMVYDHTPQREHYLWRLVEKCPKLVDLDLNAKQIDMKEIWAMARKCSSADMEGTLYDDRGKKAGDNGEGGFKKLWIAFNRKGERQHFLSQDMMREKCFRGLVELYWRQHLAFTSFSDPRQFFPFAKTLTTFRLGLRHAMISPPKIKTLNRILTLLPNLEVFILDNKISDYRVFEGLGRCPLPGCFDEQYLTHHHHHHHRSAKADDTATDEEEDMFGIKWMVKERPLLRVLSVKFTKLLQPIDMYDIDLFLIQRFRLLEKLDVRTSHNLNINAWREQKRERCGLTVRHILPQK